MQRHTPSRSAFGFTLIELLVVVSIIALLAAILFPVFSRVRENARRTGCASNLKQISLGLRQYIGDYDSRFPFDCTNRDGINGCQLHTSTSPCVTAGNCDEGWAEVVQPYVKSPQLFQCPNDKKPRPIINDNRAMPQYNYSDYWISYNLFSKHEILIKYPAMTVMSSEGFSGEGDSAFLGYSECAGTDTIPEFACNKQVAQTHLDGANYAFTDGHVKWFKGRDDQDTIEGIWDEDVTELTTPQIGSVYTFRF